MIDEERSQKLIKNIPDELKELENWVGYIFRDKKTKERITEEEMYMKVAQGVKVDKVPINLLTGSFAESNNPKTWIIFETALEMCIRKGFEGLGFVFKPPYIGVDLDGCVVDGHINEFGKEILLKVNSYAEYSPSRTGIHIYCKGQWTFGGCNTKNIEVYAEGRFFTVTGEVIDAV